MLFSVYLHGIVIDVKWGHRGQFFHWTLAQGHFQSGSSRYVWGAILFALEHAISNSVPRRKHAPLLPPRFISAVHTVSLPLQTTFCGLLRNLQLRVLFTYPALEVQMFLYVLELYFFSRALIKKLESFSDKFSQSEQIPSFSVVMKWSPLRKVCKSFLSSHLLKTNIRQFYTFRIGRMMFQLQNSGLKTWYILRYNSRSHQFLEKYFLKKKKMLVLAKRYR